MKEALAFLGILALAVSAWVLKGYSDTAVIDSKNETIKSLRETIRSKDEVIENDRDLLSQRDNQPSVLLKQDEEDNVGDDNSKDIFPQDNGFEAQDLGSGFFAYQYFGPYVFNPNHVPEPDRIPNRTPWKFGGASGIAANNCGFYVSNATNRDSDGVTSTLGQAAFLSIDDSSISQSINLKSGTYAVVFDWEARRDYRANKIAVSIDGKTLLVGTPTDCNNFQRVMTKPITLDASGKHELMFRGLGGTEKLSGDSFIDNVRIRPVDSQTFDSEK